MRTVVVGLGFDDWRCAARQLLAGQVPPEQVIWQHADDDQPLLEGLGESPGELPGTTPAPARVPRDFVLLARDVVLHRDADRLAVLYRVLWRITQGERNLLHIEVDDDVRRLTMMQRQVGLDRHRMIGFVRFVRAPGDAPEHYVAWYKPDHRVIAIAAPEFVRRFGGMPWSILTPDGSAHWDLHSLRFGPGVAQRPATEDDLVGLWKTYYTSTYNPQRDNPKVFRRLLPERFFEQMPESDAQLPPTTRMPRA